MDPVRVALLGVTHPHSVSHLKTLNLSTLVSEVVLYDEDRRAADEIREAHGEKVTSVYTNLDDLMGDGRPQVAVAAFRNDLNAELCIRLLSAGIHVISEKPIGAAGDEVQAVVEAAAAGRLKLGVMYQNRYHPLSQDARRLVREGVVGRVTSCEARLVTSQVQFRNPEHWLFKKGQAGGGILSWLGCHYIDLLTYVSGEEIAGVSAMVDTLSGEAIDVEDVATMSLRFRSGALGSLQAGYQLALSKGGYIGPSYDTYMAIRGTAGRIWWEPSSGPVRLHVESGQPSCASAPSRTIDYALPSVAAYGGAHGLAFLDDFIRSTATGEEAPATGQDALAVARVIDAAYASNDTGRHVNLGG